ncbi:type ISP restriction/modification enzyme [Curtobacterium pusillum]|uniref:type ISP restriction/modification enzyme n=1 Tax=Curtobacterium pusillum TaxID=69373 RepID=UPI0011A9D03F|nr:type ISP restriction/modification enzyme [Curtobacterium pusillum]
MDLDQAIASFIDSSRDILAVSGAKAEASLYSAFETLLKSAAYLTGPDFAFIPQVSADLVGIPDWKAVRGSELVGWVELKAASKNLRHLKGHDAEQRSRFIDGLPNLLLTNGWQWEHYRDGRLVAHAQIGAQETLTDPGALVVFPSDEDTAKLRDLLADFFSAPLSEYATIQSAVSALAVRARSLRSALIEIGPEAAGANLNELRSDFESLIFRNGQRFTWDRFVDSYVQIATFGSLLWRLESQSTIAIDHQVSLKHDTHPLLSQCLQILWSNGSRPATLLPLLQGLVQTINLIPLSLFAYEPGAADRNVTDPIVHAYEPFFAVYDSKAREASGVYYTPTQVVDQIVDGTDVLLRQSLSIENGILDTKSKFLDPATGTGTFLLGLVQAAARKAAERGLPVDAVLNDLVSLRLAAFELLPGPYTIAHQRLEVLLRILGSKPDQRLPIYLTDTLAGPEVDLLVESGFGIAGSEMMKERKSADAVKTNDDLMVVFGNPPYERLPATSTLEPFAKGLLESLTEATPLERRRDLKSTRDLYVAFWLWSLWAMQSPEQRTATASYPRFAGGDRHGIVAFITNRTWLQGGSLGGLRKIAQQNLKEAWILDLGGDTRGSDGANDFAGGDANIFDIQTGVAIVWLVYDRGYAGAAQFHHRRLFGSRRQKLEILGATFDPSAFDEVFVTAKNGFSPVRWDSEVLEKAPSLPDLFNSEPLTGFQTARDKSPFSPLGTTRESVLGEIPPTGKQVHPYLTGKLGNWSRLSDSGRRDAWSTAQRTRTSQRPPTVAGLDTGHLREVLYRPLDRRFLYDDRAWIDWYRDDLHEVFSTPTGIALITNPRGQGAGPAVIHSSLLPDQHSFNNRGGKAIWPAWRRGENGLVHNFSPVIERWLSSLGQSGDFDGAYNYVLALLSAPSYTERNWRALEADDLRIPLTGSVTLFRSARDLGRKIRSAWEQQGVSSTTHWLGSSTPDAFGPATWADGRIVFQNGRKLSGVPEAAWKWRISGYRVLPRFFKAREDWTMSLSHAEEIQKVVGSAITLIELCASANEVLSEIAPGI